MPRYFKRASATGITGVGSGGGTIPPAPPTPAGFTLNASPGLATVAAGATTDVAVTIARTGGFTGAVVVVMRSLPAGVTASSLTIASGSTAGTVTLTAASGAASTSVAVSAQGSAPLVPSASSSVALTVTSSVGVWSPTFATLPTSTYRPVRVTDWPAFTEPAFLVTGTGVSSNLQTQMQAAAASGYAHAVVVVPAGTVIEGTFGTYPLSNSTGRVSVVSSWVYANGPIRAEYQTVQESDLAKTARLNTPSTEAVISGGLYDAHTDPTYGPGAYATVAGAGCSNYHFEGIEFGPSASCNDNYGLVRVNGFNNVIGLTAMPDAWSFQHCFFRGIADTTSPSGSGIELGVKTAIVWNAKRLMVRGCRGTGLAYPSWSDFGFLTLSDWRGPIHVEANWIDSGGIPVMLGPSSGVSGVQPQDHTVVRNYFTRDRSRQTVQNPQVKSMFEVKNGDRILFEANFIADNWSGGQFRGDGIALKAVNQDNNNNSVYQYSSSNITVRHNKVQTPQPINLQATNVSVSGYLIYAMHQIDVINNLFEINHVTPDIYDGTTQDGPRSVGFGGLADAGVLGFPHSWSFRRNSWVRNVNTVAESGLWAAVILANTGHLWTDGTQHAPMTDTPFYGLEFAGNVFPSSLGGVRGWNSSTGYYGTDAATHLKFLNARMTGNIIPENAAFSTSAALNASVWTAAGYTAQAAQPVHTTDTTIPFTNATARNYRLIGASYANTGCDQDVVEAQTAHCADGLWTTPWAPYEG